MERRLAAILAADVVGYSRLMEIDETGTLAALKAHRGELIDPEIAGHRGRIVKLMGDGTLVEFASVVDAVTCAAAIQTGMSERNDGVPESRRLEFRIGVHLGDVIVEGGDIYGDGVNVAARLEGLAEPGGICISESVHDQVAGRCDAVFRDAGQQSLKNLSRPLRVYRWARTTGGDPMTVAKGDDQADTTGKVSVAVLPFANFSADEDQAFFADGIAEDLITLLSKLEPLRVLSRNSSFVYKGKAVKAQDIARDLGVRYIVEGSVRRAGGRVRITAQLIDGRSGDHVWAERYDRELTDIFAVQDEISQEIASAMSVRLSPADRGRLRAPATANLDAYDIFLKGRDHFWQHRKDDNAIAQAKFQEALALDPNFGPAHTFLSFSHLMDHINGWTGREAALQDAYDAARRGIELNKNYARSWIALGNACLWMREHERAEEAYRKAIALDPNFSMGYASLGWALTYAGKPEEAIPLLERAGRLDPHFPDARLHWLGEALYNCGRYREAADAVRRRLARRPDSDSSHMLLAACHG